MYIITQKKMLYFEPINSALIVHTLLGVKAYNTVWSGDTASDVTGPTVILNDSFSVSVVEVMLTKY